MLKNMISLDGIWDLKGIAPDGTGNIQISAQVPGHVHIDLLNAGEIPDPFWRDNADECQWIENWDWIYTREFNIDQMPGDESAILDFSGLDTYASIYLNGAFVGETANMFIPHRFDVGKILLPGSNHLEIQMPSYKKKIMGKPLEPYPAAFFTNERVHVRRMQCTFSWDWVHRFVSTGIWKSVCLYFLPQTYIQDVFVYTRCIDRYIAGLTIQLEISRKSDDVYPAQVEILDPDGNVVWSVRMTVDQEQKMLYPDLPSPKLWWPNGYGKQPIYLCKVTLLNSKNQVLDQKDTRFGIRTVRIEQLNDELRSQEQEKTLALRKLGGFEKNDDLPGKSFTLIVNGERIFCKGGNWVPASPFPSQITPEHYERLIKLASDGNINLLRCWGGGIYEPESFWDACDRYGVMISQDFMMACGRYPEDDEEFMSNLQIEIPEVIRMQRNHPSLVWWAGDNENGMNQDEDDIHYDGRKVAEEISGPTCRKMDPSRPFLPTSPFGGRPNTSWTIGDSHISAWYSGFINSDVNKYRERISQMFGRFISEYAICGAASVRSLRKFMTEEDIIGNDPRMWEYHTKNNPHSGSKTTHYQMLEKTASMLFGTAKDPYQNIKFMEYVQYEWIRLVVEAVRRQKYYCSGIQFWMYNDCWPASGWSIVDYYGFPKAGYYAMKRASQPVIASIEEGGECFKIWICNDTLTELKGAIQLRVLSWNGLSRWEMNKPFYISANISKVILTLEKKEIAEFLGLDSILVCDLTCKGICDRAYFYSGIPNQMDLPAANLIITNQKDQDSGHLQITTDQYARVVTLDADLDFSDNYFDVLPGETKTIIWRNPSKNRELPTITVSCWYSTESWQA